MPRVEDSVPANASVPGVEVTLRGAAPGYTPREASFLPFEVPGWYEAVFIELSKAQ